MNLLFNMLSIEDMTVENTRVIFNKGDFFGGEINTWSYFMEGGNFRDYDAYAERKGIQAAGNRENAPSKHNVSWMSTQEYYGATDKFVIHFVKMSDSDVYVLAAIYAPGEVEIKHRLVRKLMMKPSGKLGRNTMRKLESFNEGGELLLDVCGMFDESKEANSLLPKKIREVSLTRDELIRVTSTSECKERLSFKAVYLIRNGNTMYVGSAYGEDGLFGRWSAYATGTGGNRDVTQEFLSGATFSVLRVMHEDDSVEDVVSEENFWKEKLGTREFGLNAN